MSKQQASLYSRGISPELVRCLGFQKKLSIHTEDIRDVIMEIEGEYGGRNWAWVLKLTTTAARRIASRFVFMEAYRPYRGRHKWTRLSLTRYSDVNSAKARMYKFDKENWRHT